MDTDNPQPFAREWLYTVLAIPLVITGFVEAYSFQQLYGLTLKSPLFTHFADFNSPIGIFSVFIIYFFSQKILDYNLFIPAALTALGILAVDVIKWLLLLPHLPVTLAAFTPFIFHSSVPILFILLLRVLTQSLFSDYYNPERQPVVIFFNHSGRSWKGRKQGYEPLHKEYVFSVILFLGLCVSLVAVSWPSY